MYKLLKTYKNLENHMLNSQLTQIERLEERSILVKFYPDPIIFDENSILNFLNLKRRKVLSLKNLGIEEPTFRDLQSSEGNYCPINQKYFVLNDFLDEDLISKPCYKERQILINENSPKQEFIVYILNRFVTIRLKNSQINFENIEDLQKRIWNVLVLKAYSKLYRKFYHRLEKPYKFKFLMKMSVIFINRNIKRFSYGLDCFKSKARIFIKKYLKSAIILFLSKLYKTCILNKKFKKIYMMLSSVNYGGLIFKIPFVKYHIFIPYGFLKTRGKFPLDWVKYCLKWKITVFFKITLHSMNIRKRRLNFIGRPYFTKVVKKVKRNIKTIVGKTKQKKNRKNSNTKILKTK